jgi:hypothetical protein
MPSKVLLFPMVGATPVLAHAGRCTLTAILAGNTTAQTAYTQIFDAAAVGDVTLGTTLATWVIRANGNEVSEASGLPAGGLVFEKGIVLASTTTQGGTSGAGENVRLCIAS